MVKVTEKARLMVLEARTAQKREGAALRILVRNGGLPHVEYALHFVDSDAGLPGDLVLDAGGFSLRVDPDSAPFLEGALLDYVDGELESGFKVDAPQAQPPGMSGPVADAVRKVLEEQVNPAIAAHGGTAALVGVHDDTAYLRLGGGCQGCGMVGTTLRQGIEVMIKEAVPQIRQVRDVTDHAGGKNPYFRSPR
jgi:Fe/S biogenesis protein NfuA